MSSSKRTYSQRAKKQAAYNEEAASRKRRKQSPEDDDLRVPGARQPSISQIPPKPTKKPAKKYGGPVSIPLDDAEIDHTGSKNSAARPMDVFDKAMQRKLKPAEPQAATIYGSRKDFDDAILGQQRIKKNKNDNNKNNKKVESYLPTPPSEKQKQQAEQVYSLPAAQNSKSGNPNPTSASPITPSKTSRILKSIVEVESPLKQYNLKKYHAEPSHAPRRDILGSRLSRRSKEAKLWKSNQSNSPLFRLPDNVRQRIYKYAFKASTDKGIHTINIRFEDYKTNWKGAHGKTVDPVFKYCSTVHHGAVNPFKSERSPKVQVTNTFTLLSGVCRQLYAETAHLPFAMNWVAFDSHNIMTNFILLEGRLSRQQRESVTCIMLPDEVPGENILSYLPNLNRIYIGIDYESQGGKPSGWYSVAREEGEAPCAVHI